MDLSDRSGLSGSAESSCSSLREGFLALRRRMSSL